MTVLPPPPAVPAPKPKTKYVIVQARDRADLGEFIAELKRAADDSHYSGGMYAAFLALEDGQKLQVNICLAARIPKRPT